MKNLSKDLTPPHDRAQELLKALAREIAFFVGSRERLITDVPGLVLSRRTAPTAPASATYSPASPSSRKAASKQTSAERTSSSTSRATC